LVERGVEEVVGAGNMASDASKTEDGKGHKITARDAAATTAVGAASRLGVARHKSKVAEGAGAGAGGKSRHGSDRSSLMTAAAVAFVTIGMLALMIVMGR
jgi:hypothetical protein